MTMKKAHPAKRGCKSKWESHVKGRLLTIKMWRQNGVIEKDICKNLGISHDSLARYKKRHSELCEALKLGKEDAVAKVVDALYKRAVGYEYEEERTIGTKQAGKGLVIGRIEKIKKQVAPDVMAQMFYLQNRCSMDWRDRRQHELTGPGGQPLQQAPIIHAYIPDNGRKRDTAVIAENIKNGRNGRNGRNSRL